MPYDPRTGQYTYSGTEFSPFSGDYSRKRLEGNLVVHPFQQTFIKDLFGDVIRGGGKKYFSPEDYLSFYQSLLTPVRNEANEAFSTGRGRLLNEYSQRGGLYGGSILGGLSNLEAQRSRSLTEAGANIQSKLGMADIEYGFKQRELAAQIVNEILRGNFGVMQAKAGSSKQGGGWFSDLLRVGAAVGASFL